MTGATARAMVQTGPRTLRPGEMALPVIGPNDGLLRVDACGLCGTDLEQFDGSLAEYLNLEYPFIPGHEIVGTIVDLGELAAHRWGVAVGDRIFLEPRLQCGRCAACQAGRSCRRRGLLGPYPTYGLIPTSVSPSLWGGYSEYVYLHPDSTVHRLPAGIDPAIAVLANPLANAIEWSVKLGAPALGARVVVLGCGQRGLASLVALRARGVGSVTVTGLHKDEHKLDLAMKLGAAAALDVEGRDVVQAVRDANGGQPVDLVVDTTPHATSSMLHALELVRLGGTVVVGGHKGAKLDAFPIDDLSLRGLTIRGGTTSTYESVVSAISMLSTHTAQLAAMHTHAFALVDAEAALDALADRDQGARAVAVSLIP
jgi:threonine dehydrogenase-like Zn-dependent dehydrogenase